MEQKFIRILAYLMREEKVSCFSVERAISSAIDMKLGQSIVLDGDDNSPYRRAFLNEQFKLLNLKV